jgi:hypothetical protein
MATVNKNLWAKPRVENCAKYAIKATKYEQYNKRVRN